MDNEYVPEHKEVKLVLTYEFFSVVYFTNPFSAQNLSLAEGNFDVETRLAKIHVSTSNENAYRERQVSYLGGIINGLK